MKLVRIFESTKSNLFAIKYAGEELDEFHRNLDNWNNPEYLFHFFNDHEKDLSFFNINPSKAARQTSRIAGELEDQIYDACEYGPDDVSSSLQTIFIPLNNHETALDVEHQRTKARQKWLRFYAIRFSENCFVISGGVIKLTLQMKEREHTRLELLKIQRTIDFLKEHDLFDEEDFDLLEL